MTELPIPSWARDHHGETEVYTKKDMIDYGRQCVEDYKASRKPVAWATYAQWGDMVTFDKPDWGKAEWKAPKPTTVPLYRLDEEQT